MSNFSNRKANVSAISTNNNTAKETKDLLMEKIMARISIQDEKIDKLTKLVEECLTGNHMVLNTFNNDIKGTIGNMARVTGVMLSDIVTIKDCLQLDTNKVASKANGNNDGNNEGSGKRSNKSDKGSGIYILSSLDINMISDKVCSEIKNGNGKAVLEKLFQKTKAFSDYEDFEKHFKSAWKSFAECTKYISLPYIKKFGQRTYELIEAVKEAGNKGNGKQEAKQEVTKENPNGNLVDIAYFAKSFNVDKEKIIELVNMISEEMTKDQLINGRFDDQDREWILTESLGKDLSKSNKAYQNGFLGYLVKCIQK